nr:hypothetical protein [Tanacetum cinerariifolium]
MEEDLHKFLINDASDNDDDDDDGAYLIISLDE